ncbi:hypothetical protein AGOR_G00123740 [Albula goreensis]|uniref:Ubiquitin-like domain-containing protein n=1 Tax=Albula goreensis TaxID=1534307 RepID=A0A8T3D7B1_9TELE|nr:hypothetical protein AGOR_G00123740 [Albula goreensis]
MWTVPVIFMGWLLRVTVLHECIGTRVFEVLPSTTIGDVKQLIYEGTDFPVAEQQLFFNGKPVMTKRP